MSYESARFILSQNKNRFLTGDDSRVHLLEPEVKKDSITWAHIRSPPPNKFKVQKSSDKFLAPKQRNSAHPIYGT